MRITLEQKTKEVQIKVQTNYQDADKQRNW